MYLCGFNFFCHVLYSLDKNFSVFIILKSPPEFHQNLTNFNNEKGGLKELVGYFKSVIATASISP